MAKAKKLTADQAQKVVNNLQRIIDYVETEPEPWISVGYTKQGLKILIEQINGGYIL